MSWQLLAARIITYSIIIVGNRINSMLFKPKYESSSIHNLTGYEPGDHISRL
jgi:hypothetical protein